MNNTTNDTEEEKIEIVEGRVTEALPATLFRVKTEKGVEILSYLGGRMRVHKIKVLVGDKVSVQYTNGLCWQVQDQGKVYSISGNEIAILKKGSKSKGWKFRPGQSCKIEKINKFA